MSRSLSRRKRHRARTHEQKLAFILKHQSRVADPTNTRQVERKYTELKRVPWHLEHKADKATREKLKARGFHVTKRGVIVDGPRNVRREPISGSKMEIQKDGTIKWSVKQRRDYIVGMTKKEKSEFAKDPSAFIEKKKRELQEKNPTLRRKRKIQVRLQWGAYQATKDFSPSLFTTRYPQFAKWLRSVRRDQREKADRLVGLHFTVHVPKKRKTRRRKRK